MSEPTVVEPPKPLSPPGKPDAALPQNATETSSALDDSMRWWLAYGTLVLTFAWFFVTYFYPSHMSEKAVDSIDTALLLWNTQNLSYFFGSSSGSKIRRMAIENPTR